MKTTSIIRVPMMATAVLLAAVFALGFGSQTAWASDDINVDKVKKTVTYSFMYYPASEDAGMNAWEFYSKKGNKITKVKSSNKSVASVKVNSKKKFTFTLKKAGKTTLTFKCKGKSYKISVRVAKYASPVKSLKVGKTEYAKSLKKSPGSALPLASGKLSVKAASGWKYVSASYYDTAADKQKSIKLGKKVPKNADYLYVNMRHKKTGAIAILFMYPEGQA